MDTTKPLLSGLAATIVGTIGLLVVTLSPSLPTTWAFVAGLVGFSMCVLAGFSARPPAFIEGKPILQGAALSIAVAVAGMFERFWPLIPSGWPQALAAGIGALVGWLTGKAIPMAGAPSPQPFLASAGFQVGGTRGAAEILTRAGR